MKVKIDSSRCVNCWACYKELPQIFCPQDKTMTAKNLVPRELEDDLVETAQICPTGAIIIVK